jgi:hypothetical protein
MSGVPPSCLQTAINSSVRERLATITPTCHKKAKRRKKTKIFLPFFEVLEVSVAFFRHEEHSAAAGFHRLLILEQGFLHDQNAGGSRPAWGKRENGSLEEDSEESKSKKLDQTNKLVWRQENSILRVQRA